MSNIAGYDLARDKIIYLWDCQGRGPVIEAYKERKKKLAKEAAFAWRKRSRPKLYKTHWLVEDFDLLVWRLIELIGLAKDTAVLALL